MKRRLQFSAGAKRDLRDIWRHSIAAWGPKQTDEYLASFETALGLIDANPVIARKATSIRPGLLRYPVGSHVVFFRMTDDEFRIVRILHGHMDHKVHLTPRA